MKDRQRKVEHKQTHKDKEMKLKEYAAAAALVVLFFLIFAIAGSGDYAVTQAEQCWSRTHSQSCGK